MALTTNPQSYLPVGIRLFWMNLKWLFSFQKYKGQKFATPQIPAEEENSDISDTERLKPRTRDSELVLFTVLALLGGVLLYWRNFVLMG